MARELTSAGLSVKTQDEVREDLAIAIHGSSEFGEETRVGPSSVVGNLIDAHSESIADQDDMTQAVYDAFDPDAAEGVQLDNLCGLTGVVREEATYSTIVLTLAGTASTEIPAGSRVQVTPDGPIFATDAIATIGGGGTVDVAATCTTSGPMEASAGSSWTIVDSVSGWTGVSNAADATLGVVEETDPVVRSRRERSFSLPGSSTDHSLRARLEALDDVQSATVISNRELTTDSFGILGKSFRSVLWPDSGLDEDAIAETIWKYHPSGIRSDGAESAVITDDQGYEQTVRWAYADEQVVYLIANITTNSDYPANGDDLVEAALLAYGATLLPGWSVKPDLLEAIVQLGYSPAEIDSVPGIEEIEVLAKIGSAPGSGDTGAITIELTQIATFDSAHTTVNST